MRRSPKLFEAKLCHKAICLDRGREFLEAFSLLLIFQRIYIWSVMDYQALWSHLITLHEPHLGEPFYLLRNEMHSMWNQLFKMASKYWRWKFSLHCHCCFIIIFLWFFFEKSWNDRKGFSFTSICLNFEINQENNNGNIYTI